MLTMAASTPGSGAAGAIVGLIYLAVLAFFLVAMWRLYSKAGQPGWTGIIPIVNTFYLLKIVGRPFWWFFVFLIPFIGWIWAIIAMHGLSRSFGHGGWFTVGLIFLPFIFFPILAFGSSRYSGPAAAQTAARH